MINFGGCDCGAYFSAAITCLIVLKAIFMVLSTASRASTTTGFVSAEVVGAGGDSAVGEALKMGLLYDAKVVAGL